MLDREPLRAALSNSNVQAFYRVVREGESRQDDIAYRMRFGGHNKPAKYFDDFSRHPKIFEPTREPGKLSSAAGAPQATWTTWSEEQKKYGWPDFTPASQDEFFVARLIYRKALQAVIAGKFDQACRLCHDEWTSLPGGAEENSATARARETYVKWGGKFEPVETIGAIELEAPAAEYNEATATSPVPEPIQHQEKPMPAPILLSLLPALIDLIPKLGSIFGSGSEVANRNIAAATVVADAVKAATNAPNLQAAIEEMQANPAALKAANAAVDDIWPSITEVGGGIAAARAAALSPDGLPFWRQAPFWITVMLLPLVYLVVIASLAQHELIGQITSETRAQVIGGVMGVILGGVIGFFYGTSVGSQRKDSIIANK